MNPEDDYAGGQAYRWNGTWVSEAGVDVHMTVLEYTLPPDIPLLSVVPDEIDREAFLGGTATGDDVFNVSNPGIGTVNYIVAESAAWFSVNPPAGSVTDEADPITITYDNGVISTLGVGVYVEAITVTSPEAENSPQTVTVTLMIDTLPPDFDGDLDVDQGDFGHLQACYSGPGISQALPECQDALLDDDDDVDQNDFSILQGCLSGEHIPADLACMN
jgi:hypothetical protein